MVIGAAPEVASCDHEFVSTYFKASQRDLWNPSNGVADLFLRTLDAVTPLVGVEHGITDNGHDEFDIDLNRFVPFVAPCWKVVLSRRWSWSTGLVTVWPHWPNRPTLTRMTCRLAQRALARSATRPACEIVRTSSPGPCRSEHKAVDASDGMTSPRCTRVREARVLPISSR